MRRRSRAALLLAALALPLAGIGVFWASLGALDLSAASGRSTTVLDREGRLLRPFLTPDGRWKLPVKARDVDPRFLAMLQAYEDRRFQSHYGVDPLAMLRAARQFVTSGRIRSGGSTLTMQVARLLEPREERTLVAKLRQILRAIELERRFSKEEILTLYLSLAPYGGNLEGIRAASFAYFGKEPKRLSTAEAALLVALPQSPETRRPDRAASTARIARDRVLASAAAASVLTGAEATQAQGEPLPTARRPFPHLAPHVAEQVVAQAPAASEHRLTLDGDWQRALEQLARERSAGMADKVSIAMVVVDNASGAIRASVGGVDYFSQERAGSVDLTRALRSPGSALKPFIYALAFDNGLAHPETMLEDRPTRYGLYVPENFDLTFQGMVSARKALQNSLNVPAVELLSAFGPQRFLSRLKDTGAAIAMPRENAPGLAIGLGGLGITLQDLTRLYAGLARGGEMIPLSVKPPEGMTPLPAQRFVEPVAAWYVTDVLLGAPPPLNASPGHIAFKTGTSYGYRDAFAVGYDRTHTIGVWVGRADNGAVPGLVGRVVAAPILFDAFARIGMDPRAFPAPPGVTSTTSMALPPPLRHLRQDVPKTLAAIGTGPLRVAFPPDGARIDMAAEQDNGAALLNLKVSGGAPPFTWLVNGAPVISGQTRRQSEWRPEGLGFMRISVIDAQGGSDSVAVRLQ